MKPFFSVIIPAYNAQGTIVGCLDSIVRQRTDNFQYEVIIVDDCSFDATPEIINSYISKYQAITPPPDSAQYNCLIRLICHKGNKRQGGARNTGLGVARGEWVMFVDADDCWVFDNVLLTIHELIKIHDVDLIRSKSWKCLTGQTQENGFISDLDYRETDSIKLFQSSGFGYQVWTGAYKKSVLDKHDITFVEHMFYEDTAWNTRLMSRGLRVGVIDFPFYGYCENGASTTRTRSLTSFRDNIRSCIEVSNVLQACPDESFCKVGYQRIKGTIISVIKMSRDFRVSDSRRELAVLRKAGILGTSLYRLSKGETLLLRCLRFTPLLLLGALRMATLAKRVLRHSFRK